MGHWTKAFNDKTSASHTGICSDKLAILEGTVVVLTLSCDNSHHRSTDDAPFLHHDTAHNLDWYVPGA